MVRAVGTARRPSSIASDGQVRMISCGADKSIYFRTAQKVRGLGFPEGGSRWQWGLSTSPLPGVTRGEERRKQSFLGLLRHLGLGSTHMLHPCSPEMECSLHGHTMWYGRRPSMTWMWSPAGSTRPLAARTEIFGGNPFLRQSDCIPSCPGRGVSSGQLRPHVCRFGPGLCAPSSPQNGTLPHPRDSSPFGVGVWLP